MKKDVCEHSIHLVFFGRRLFLQGVLYHMAIIDTRVALGTAVRIKTNCLEYATRQHVPTLMWRKLVAHARLVTRDRAHVKQFSKTKRKISIDHSIYLLLFGRGSFFIL